MGLLEASIAGLLASKLVVTRGRTTSASLPRAAETKGLPCPAVAAATGQRAARVVVAVPAATEASSRRAEPFPRAALDGSASGVSAQAAVATCVAFSACVVRKRVSGPGAKAREARAPGALSRPEPVLVQLACASACGMLLAATWLSTAVIAVPAYVARLPTCTRAPVLA